MTEPSTPATPATPAIPGSPTTPGTPATPADTGRTTEFEHDVVELLTETAREATACESRSAGTEHLVHMLVMGETKAGEAIAPGMRQAGGLGGTVMALTSPDSSRPWVHGDTAAGPDPLPGHPGDEEEADAVWREAVWRAARKKARRGAPEEGTFPPEPSEALRACLLRALRLARLEGTTSVRCRHVARAMLQLPDSRALEAMALQRIDRTAASVALDALDAGAAADPDFPEPPSVRGMRGTGVLGEGGGLSRLLMSWMFRSGPEGDGLLSSVFLEAERQTVRRGHGVVEPVDLLLAVLALDRALAVTGRSFPETTAAVNEAAALLRTYGARHASLAEAARACVADPLPGPLPAATEVPRSPAVERVRSVAQLTAGERGSDTVGTVHVLAALLADDEGEAALLLRAEGVDVAALKDRLSPDPAA
ncbi:Clp protease N-terminal domain-containing protein [Streptomyces sp. NPDC059096]|uniref:Clp protease N-terminal domain-containing protein n=1 Tax=Streptomyces sp. NPDC059096 TaxID=3346727 RepID=UPI0036A78C18